MIGLDYGLRRIGLAVGVTAGVTVGESGLGTARPLSVVANVNGTPDWMALDACLAEWQPVALVVGWPLDADGAEQAMTAHVKGFIKRLRKRYALPVHRVDERYSSIDAADELRRQRSSGQRQRRTTHGDVDTLAAALILERWFAMEGAATSEWKR